MLLNLISRFKNYLKGLAYRVDTKFLHMNVDHIMTVSLRAWVSDYLENAVFIKMTIS